MDNVVNGDTSGNSRFILFKKYTLCFFLDFRCDNVYCNGNSYNTVLRRYPVLLYIIIYNVCKNYKYDTRFAVVPRASNHFLIADFD